jgi:hypothetical protein
MTQVLPTTSFTCCAHDHFVGSCARPLRAKDALVAQAGRLFLCSSGRRSGHILACSEDASSQNVKVKPTLAAIMPREVHMKYLTILIIFSTLTLNFAADTKPAPNFPVTELAELSKLYDQQLNRLNTIIYILTILVGLVTVAAPIFLYFYQVRPGARLKRTIDSLDDTIYKKLKQFLKDDIESRIEESLNNMTAPDESVAMDAANYLSLNQYNIGTDSHMLKIFAILNMDPDANRANVLASILAKKKNKYADQYFRSLIERKINNSTLNFYAIRYFTLFDFDNSLSWIRNFIRTNNVAPGNTPQINNGQISANYSNVAFNLINISKTNFLKLINDQDLNISLDKDIRRMISHGLIQQAKQANVENEVKNSLLLKDTDNKA